MVHNYDAWIAELLACHFLSENEMLLLCNRVRSLLLEESNIQPVSSPVTICGDIHGQYVRLLHTPLTRSYAKRNETKTHVCV